MIPKTFVRHLEACELLGTNEEGVRQLLMQGRLAAYIHLKEAPAQLKMFHGGVAMSRGRNAHARWTPATKPYPNATGNYYLLTGWYLLESDTTQDAALADEFVGIPCVVPPSENDGFLDAGDVWELSIERRGVNLGDYQYDDYVEASIDLPRLKDLWFRIEAIEELQAAGIGVRQSTTVEKRGDVEKPLGNRERNNLLRIITALAKHAEVDISEGSDGVAKVDALIVAAGFDGPKVKTIREVLAAARDLD